MAGEDAFGNNAEFTADLTVDDVEAEGFDDEMDPYDALTERTVTLAITDGLSFACLGSPEEFIYQMSPKLWHRLHNLSGTWQLKGFGTTWPAIRKSLVRVHRQR